MEMEIKSKEKQTEGQPFVHPRPACILMSDIALRRLSGHPDATSAAAGSIFSVSSEGKSKTSTKPNHLWAIIQKGSEFSGVCSVCFPS